MSQSTNISLEGRTALITGGASGIGVACARAFSRAGATVTVCDQNEQAVKELAEEIGGGGEITGPWISQIPRRWNFSP